MGRIKIYYSTLECVHVGMAIYFTSYGSFCSEKIEFNSANE